MAAYRLPGLGRGALAAPVARISSRPRRWWNHFLLVCATVFSGAVGRRGAHRRPRRRLNLLLAAAGVNYVMGVPCSDDVMLNYESTSYHDAALVRQLFQLRPASEFLHWLKSSGIFHNGRLASIDHPALLKQFTRLLE